MVTPTLPGISVPRTINAAVDVPERAISPAPISTRIDSKRVATEKSIIAWKAAETLGLVIARVRRVTQIAIIDDVPEIAVAGIRDQKTPSLV